MVVTVRHFSLSLIFFQEIQVTVESGSLENFICTHAWLPQTFFSSEKRLTSPPLPSCPPHLQWQCFMRYLDIRDTSCNFLAELLKTCKQCDTTGSAFLCNHCTFHIAMKGISQSTVRGYQMFECKRRAGWLWRTAIQTGKWKGRGSVDEKIYGVF